MLGAVHARLPEQIHPREPLLHARRDDAPRVQGVLGQALEQAGHSVGHLVGVHQAAYTGEEELLAVRPLATDRGDADRKDHHALQLAAEEHLLEGPLVRPQGEGVRALRGARRLEDRPLDVLDHDEMRMVGRPRRRRREPGGIVMQMEREEQPGHADGHGVEPGALPAQPGAQLLGGVARQGSHRLDRRAVATVAAAAGGGPRRLHLLGRLLEDPRRQRPDLVEPLEELPRLARVQRLRDEALLDHVPDVVHDLPLEGARRVRRHEVLHALAQHAERLAGEAAGDRPGQLAARAAHHPVRLLAAALE